MAGGKKIGKATKREKKEKTEEKAVFHDCESDNELVQAESAHQGDLSFIAQSLDDPNAFHKELKAIVSTTQQLLCKFDSRFKPTCKRYRRRTHRRTANVSESDRSVRSAKSVLLEIHLQMPNPAQGNNITYHQVSTRNENTFQVLPTQTTKEQLNYKSQKQQKPIEESTADDEMQPKFSNQQPLKCSNQKLCLPYVRNAKTNDNIDEDSSVPTSFNKTEPEEYTTSQTNPSLITYPSQGTHATNCTYFMDINTIEQYVVRPNVKEEEFKYYMQESIVTPQLPINYASPSFIPANNTAFSAIVPPGFPIQSQPMQSTLPSQIQPQLEQQLPAPHQPETAADYPPAPFAQIPSLPGQPAQNYTIPASPSLLGTPKTQAAASGLPGQSSNQVAAPAMPTQPSYPVTFSGLPGDSSYQAGASELPGKPAALVLPTQVSNQVAASVPSGQPSFQTAAPVLPGQLSYEVAAPSLPGQFSYQIPPPDLTGQPSYQTADPRLPGQPNFQVPSTSFPEQLSHQAAIPETLLPTNNGVAFPVMPGQPSSYQATIQSNYVSYNQLKSDKKCKSKNDPKKRRGKCYKIENECEYFSAESCSDNDEVDDQYNDEYPEDELKIRKKMKVSGTKFIENVTGDARTDLIKKLLNELVILMAQSNHILPTEENMNRVETFETTQEPSNVKFTVQHETKFKKHQDVSETSERWFVTSGMRSNLNEMEPTGNVTGWQPGAEQITFDDAITDGEIAKNKSEVQIVKDEDNCEMTEICGEDEKSSQTIGDSKSSNLMNEQKEKCDTIQEDCCDCNDSERICSSLEQILNKQKSDTKSPNGECNCCHCRAVKKKLASNTLASVKNNDCKSSREKKFLELIFAASESPSNDLSELQSVFKMPSHPINLPSSPRCPPKSGALQDSFPVTITNVTALGTSSLYVKWTIHDCYNIGGYEIYVDNFLTNRYFNGNHTAAVICNVDVSRCQKIVLVAHPKIEEIGEGPGKNAYNSNLALSNNRDSRQWTPSVYLYDPTNLY